MSTASKVAKYLAIAFALFLVVNIMLLIMNGIGLIGNIFDGNNSSKISNLEELSINGNVQALDIDVESINIIIKIGDEFRAETNNEDVTCRDENNKLLISQKDSNWFNKKDNGDLVIYVPSNFVFDVFSIENGAGSINIAELYTRRLDLDLGAGKVSINKLTVLGNVEIDGGAGDISIDDGDINNLDLDMGVGKLTLRSSITGRSEIDSGVGELSLDLIGDLDDYKIKVDKGVGSVNIDGQSISDNKYYGTGSSLIDIDGGVGSIKINFVGDNY